MISLPQPSPAHLAYLRACGTRVVPLERPHLWRLWITSHSGVSCLSDLVSDDLARMRLVERKYDGSGWRLTDEGLRVARAFEERMP